MTLQASHLQTRNLFVGYSGKVVLRGISIGVERGEVVGMFGANGSGKSTTLKAIAGLAPRVDGEIQLGGHSIGGKQTWDIARLGVGFVPQDDRAFGDLSVLENLELGGMLLPAGERTARLAEVHRQFPVLAERRGQAVASLSGGQRAMLSMGIALMAPGLSTLLLDEPLAGLSPVMGDTLLNLVRRFAVEYQLAVLIVEQNVLRTMRAVDRAYILRLGEIVFEGRPDAIREERDLWQYF